MNKDIFIFKNLKLTNLKERTAHYRELDKLFKKILCENPRETIKVGNFIYKKMEYSIAASYNYKDLSLSSSIKDDVKLKSHGYCLNKSGDFFYFTGWAYQKTLLVNFDNVEDDFSKWDCFNIFQKNTLKNKVDAL